MARAVARREAGGGECAGEERQAGGDRGRAVERGGREREGTTRGTMTALHSTPTVRGPDGPRSEGQIAELGRHHRTQTTDAAGRAATDQVDIHTGSGRGGDGEGEMDERPSSMERGRQLRALHVCVVAQGG
jgi:hypothetical protein